MIDYFFVSNVLLRTYAYIYTHAHNAQKVCKVTQKNP